MKRPLKNVGASVRMKLASIRDRTGIDYNQLLINYAIERFLYRLSKSPHAKDFVLKGAMLFTLWEGAPHRETRDLDLLGFGESSIPRLVEIFRSICAVNVPDDGLRFENVRGENIRAAQEYGGIRISLDAVLEKALIPMAVDVGFGDQITPRPKEVEFPTLLDFPKPRLRAYPAETVIAEKVQAMVTLGIANSRMKDFFDVWYLGKTGSFDGRVLCKAIRSTFERRKTPCPRETPLALTSEFWSNPSKRTQWGAFCRKNSRVQAPADLKDVVEFIAGLLVLPLRAAGGESEFTQVWPPAGPWRAG